MKKQKQYKSYRSPGTLLAERIWGTSWTYMRTVADNVREPFLILDRNLNVIAGNESFYDTFQVRPKDTENRLFFELGTGEWNAPELRELLEDVLPENTFFKGFQVDHYFPKVGRKVMMLNARRIYPQDPHFKDPMPIIFLAMEDITEMTLIAEKLATMNERFEARLAERTAYLESRVDELMKANELVIDKRDLERVSL